MRCDIGAEGKFRSPRREGPAGTYAKASATAFPQAAVLAAPPVAGSQLWFGEHTLDRPDDAAAASASPRCSSIIAPDQIWPIGLAMPLPAMSGAEPCTGSNSDGKSRSGLMFAEGAMPIVPHTGRPEVGQDVAEQIRADYDIEPIGVEHEMRGENVDVELIVRTSG